MDVEKSGSTYVSQFLRDFLDDDEVRFRKHAPMEDRPPEGRLHVLSVRDPFDTYLSLYSYGCQGKGGLSGTLRDAGLGGLYDGSSAGFSRWLEVVLDPQYSSALNPPTYHRSGVAPVAGLLSFRVARLSTVRPMRWISAVRSAEELVTEYAARVRADVVVRNESLIDDLEDLVRRPELRWRPSREVALEALSRTRRVNTSRRLDRDPGFSVPDDARRRVLDREPLLARYFRYDEGHRTSTNEATAARSSA
ncbi:sulfotransferase family protein [Isoptericola aurantiacus]|uniref:hypothetical protein n=1 Tax=Isoptericola aurantiacus TaxID=3377839 RepID=UPI00383BD074